MSEHRKNQTYPICNVASDDADYFTMVFHNKVVAYRYNIPMFEENIENISGAVFVRDTLFYSLKYDNKIYCCKHNVKSCVAEIQEYATIRIWKYVSYSNNWLVIEASKDNVDLTDPRNSIENYTKILLFDIIGNSILLELPMPYFVDMGISEDNVAVLLGEGCEGTEYYECGDGSDEVFLTSIKFETSNGKVDVMDSLHIQTIYDNFEERISARTYSKKRMCFPLFDRYLYNWLIPKSLSIHSKYVIYYCKDIKGIIISSYEDGSVFRVFQLSLAYNINTQYYYNEDTNIFTIIDDGRIEQYFITLRNPNIINELNDYYFNYKGRLQNNWDFTNLLYTAIHNTKCERISDMKYNYDVALSFAGEDRSYVEKIYMLLKERQIRVFYDNDKRSQLWGEDLPELLDQIYRKDTKFCIVFCSQNYPKKKWTILESKSYKAAQIETGRYDYILPLVMDDTEIPGILKTQGYLDARKLSPEEIVDAFIIKLEEFDQV